LADLIDGVGVFEGCRCQGAKDFSFQVYVGNPGGVAVTEWGGIASQASLLLRQNGHRKDEPCLAPILIRRSDEPKLEVGAVVGIRMAWSEWFWPGSSLLATCGMRFNASSN
jgi:hypothetical protein